MSSLWRKAAILTGAEAPQTGERRQKTSQLEVLVTRGTNSQIRPHLADLDKNTCASEKTFRTAQNPV